MRLTEQTTEAVFDDVYVPQTVWVSDWGTLHFSYDHNHQGLWDEVNDPHGMPIATPETLEQARSIIESKGYTIS